MRRTVDTIVPGRRWLLPSVLLGTGLLSTSLIGFARSPYARTEDLRALVEGVVQRQEALHEEARTLEALTAAGAAERLVQLERSLGAVLPEAPDEVRLFFLGRLVAHALDVELDELSIGEPLALGLALGREDVGERPVNLRGRATVQALVDLVDALRLAGVPVAVVDARGTRTPAAPSTGTFLDEPYSFSLTLALYERVAATTTRTDP